MTHEASIDTALSCWLSKLCSHELCVELSVILDVLSED